MPRVALFNDTSVTLHHGCNAVMQTIAAGLEERGLDLRYAWPVGSDWRPFRERLLREPVDLVVVNGEGSIHHSRERDRARYLCALGPFARDELNVPSALVNASVQSLEPAEIEALQAFDLVTVREGASRDELADHGIEADIVPDLSLGAVAGGDDAATRRGGDVLVTDSVLDDASDALRDLASRIGGSFESMRRRPRLRERLATSARKRFAPLGPARRSIRVTSDYGGFIRRLRSVDAIVTGRFHTVMLCLATDTPFLAMPSNTPKIEATLRDALGETVRLIAPDDMDGAALERRLNDGIGFGPAERERLADYRRKAAEARASTFDRIAGLLS